MFEKLRDLFTNQLVTKVVGALLGSAVIAAAGHTILNYVVALPMASQVVFDIALIVGAYAVLWKFAEKYGVGNTPRVRRRELIARGRACVTRVHTKALENHVDDTATIRAYLAADPDFLPLRPHLSETFRSVFDGRSALAGRSSIAPPMDSILIMLNRDLDELEHNWGLQDI